MNVFAHVALASRATGDAEPDERFLLGAALSDLATYGRFRLLGETPDPVIRDGMAFHHRSDDAFHRHPWFRERNRSASEALEERGLGRGPARACGHVGVELLLDGALHPLTSDHERFQRVLQATRRLRPELIPLVSPDRQGAWSQHLEELAVVRRLPAYDDPDAVAQRLQRICGRRPRLAFPPSAVGEVASVLGELLPSIRATGEELIDELASALGPQEDEPAPGQSAVGASAAARFMSAARTGQSYGRSSGSSGNTSR